MELPDATKNEQIRMVNYLIKFPVAKIVCNVYCHCKCNKKANTFWQTTGPSHVSVVRRDFRRLGASSPPWLDGYSLYCHEFWTITCLTTYCMCKHLMQRKLGNSSFGIVTKIRSLKVKNTPENNAVNAVQL